MGYCYHFTRLSSTAAQYRSGVLAYNLLAKAISLFAPGDQARPSTDIDALIFIAIFANFHKCGLWQEVYGMERLAVACIRVGVERLNIVPMDKSFGTKSLGDQHDILRGLQASCDQIGIGGTAIVAWLREAKIQYLAAADYRGLMPKLSWQDLFSLINRQLAYDDPVVIEHIRQAQSNRPTKSIMYGRRNLIQHVRATSGQ